MRQSSLNTIYKSTHCNWCVGLVLRITAAAADVQDQFLLLVELHKIATLKSEVTFWRIWQIRNANCWNLIIMIRQSLSNLDSHISCSLFAPPLDEFPPFWSEIWNLENIHFDGPPPGYKWNVANMGHCSINRSLVSEVILKGTMIWELQEKRYMIDHKKNSKDYSSEAYCCRCSPEKRIDLSHWHVHIFEKYHSF